MSKSKIEYNLSQLAIHDHEEFNALNDALADPRWCGPAVISEALNELAFNNPQYNLELISEAAVRRHRKKKNVSKEAA